MSTPARIDCQHCHSNPSTVANSDVAMLLCDDCQDKLDLFVHENRNLMSSDVNAWWAGYDGVLA